MKTTQNRGLTFFRTAGLLAVLVALLLPASASAADSIYWSNEDGSNSIRYGPLSGDNGGSTPAQTLFDDGFVNVCGVAVDPANNKIYWANFSTQEIRVGNLDGTGLASTLFTDPAGSDSSGLSIVPPPNKTYLFPYPTLFRPV